MNSLAIDPGDVCIVRLNAQKLTELIDLQNEVSARLIMPEFYAAVADAKLEELLGEDGLCFGAEHAGRLVGFFGVLFVGEREENVGRDIGLPPRNFHWLHISRQSSYCLNTVKSDSKDVCFMRCFPALALYYLQNRRILLS